MSPFLPPQVRMLAPMDGCKTAEEGVGGAETPSSPEPYNGRAVVDLICSMAKLELTSDSGAVLIRRL